MDLLSSSGKKKRRETPIMFDPVDQDIPQIENSSLYQTQQNRCLSPFFFTWRPKIHCLKRNEFVRFKDFFGLKKK
jgi:hypothetical protein